MVFSSIAFLFLFLPVFLVAYYGLRGLAARNVLLIVASLFFYAWGNPHWILFLLGSAVVDWGNGLWIERHRDSALKIWGVVSTLVFNLGLLLLFKYSRFVADTGNALFGTHWTVGDPSLPVGMSFYTFETISYTIDVYRGTARAQPSFPKFLVFICSFPRLVAGPIVRYNQVAHELSERPTDVAEISQGVTRFCRGLFKKVFFANVAGQLTARFLDAGPADLTVAGAWFGLVMFTLQIYYDFSGYSDMAIGLGHMVGFTLPENFRHPYIATSITDFWRRWHMTMSAFFRDYVYIPLGGNRRLQWRNILLVWAATGLWHGASWNFVLWGLYFAVILLIEKWVVLRLLAKLPRLVAHAYALFLIVLGWAIFHITDLGRLGRTIALLFGFGGAPASDYTLTQAISANAFWLAAAFLFCLPVRTWAATALEGRPATRAALAAPVSLAFLAVSVTLLVGSSYNPFIYFRF